MSVESFLKHADVLLQRSDIILSRSPTLSSRLIRAATGGFFSHAGLVFLVPKPEDGFDSTFVLESVSSGVGLANLRDYIDRKRGHSDIVIRRLDAPWFDDAMRAQVRGRMLNHVKARYDYGRVFRMALSVLFGLQLGYSRMAKGQDQSMPDAVRKTRRRRAKWVPPQFICSGFVQYGFAEAARRHRHPVREVLFREDLDARDQQGLLAVTPEDIATSGRLTWLYAITRGRVHLVSSYEEAKAVISGAKR
jgi:hypothetical protein